MQHFPQEFLEAPRPLVALVGVPELHTKVAEYLQSLQPPVLSLSIHDPAKVTALGGRERRPPDAKLPPPVGIIKADWLTKHKERSASVVVVFLERERVYGDPAQWMGVCAEVDNIKNVVRGRNTKLLVVVVHSTNAGEPNEERFATLRKRAEVDPRCCLLFAAATADAPELRRSLARLGGAALEAAAAFYREEGRRVKARVERRAYSHSELSVRYYFKMAVFCEFGRDWPGALHNYQAAYATLRELQLQHTPAELQPVQAMVELRAVAEALNLKVCSFLLHSGREGDAVRWFCRHLDWYRRRVGPPEGAFLHWAWVSRQYQVFGELLQQRQLAAGGAAGTGTAAAAAGAAVPGGGAGEAPGGGGGGGGGGAGAGAGVGAGAGTGGGGGGGDEDYVRPPLPVKREALYDDVYAHRAQQVMQAPPRPATVDAFRNFQEEAEERMRGNGAAAQGGEPPGGGPPTNTLATMYRPPFDILFQGSFEQAKAEGVKESKWLLVNVQSHNEFASYMLNRDTWSQSLVKETLGSYFIFWQIYDDSEEGARVGTYYKLVAAPVVMVVDPVTGQKMRCWEGMLQPERLLEELLPYMDRGPMDRQIPPLKKPRDVHKAGAKPGAGADAGGSSAAAAAASAAAEPASAARPGDLDEDDELQRALAASLESIEGPTSRSSPAAAGATPGAGLGRASPAGTSRPSSEHPSRRHGAQVPQDASKMLGDATAEAAAEAGGGETGNGAASRGPGGAASAIVPLPEEPEASNPLACRVAVRFPDGRRGQRRFLQSDPVKFLQSYCCAQVPEAEGGARSFRLAQALPGAPPIDLDVEATIKDLGLANSLIAMTWIQ